MEEAWKKAGIIFGVGTVVFSISLLLSIQFYFMEDEYGGYYYVDEYESETWANACSGYDGDPVCHELEQEKYPLIGGALLCAGLALVCFAKQEEENRVASSRGLNNLQTSHGENLQPAPITIEIKEK